MNTPKTTTCLQTFKESLLSIKDLGLEDQVKAVQFLEKRLEESRTLAGEKCEELKRALKIQSENNNEPVEKKQKLDLDKELNEENGNDLPPSDDLSVPLPRGSVSSEPSTKQSLKVDSSGQPLLFSYGGSLDSAGGTSAVSNAGAVASFPAALESGSIGSSGASLTKSGESSISIDKLGERTYTGGTQQSLPAPKKPVGLFGLPLPTPTKPAKTGSVGFSGLGGISSNIHEGVFSFGFSFRKPDVVALPIESSEMEFRPTNEIEGHVQCITAMEEFKNISLEELRYQDYAAGKNGRIDEVTQMKNKELEKQKTTREWLGCNQILYEFHDLRGPTWHGKIQKLLEILKAPNRDCNKKTLIFVKDEAYRAYSVAKTLMNEKLISFQNTYTLHDIRFSFTKDHPILVVTDEICRGEHIAGVEDVINYDLPDTCAVFLERTGRVDKVSQLWGRVVSFCEPGSDDLTEELRKMMTDVGAKVPCWMESG